MMKLSQQGLNLIKRFEELRLYAYQDSAGIWTIGWGHTATAKPGMRITEDYAERLLRRDVDWAEKAVNELEADLNQNQFDALVSFAFNVGASKFKGSSPARFAKEGKHNLVPSRLMLWVKAHDPNSGKLVELQGLVNRRAIEGKLYAQKATPAVAVTPPASETPSQAGWMPKAVIAAVAAALAFLAAWIFKGG